MILRIRIKTNPTNKTSDPDANMLCLSKLQSSKNMPPRLMLYPDNLQKPGHITDARLAALKGDNRRVIGVGFFALVRFLQSATSGT